MDLSTLIAVCASIVATCSTLVGTVLALDRRRQKDAVRRADEGRKLDEVWQHFAEPEPGAGHFNLPTQLKVLTGEVARANKLAVQANETAERSATDLREHMRDELEENQERNAVVSLLTEEVRGLRSDVMEVRRAG